MLALTEFLTANKVSPAMWQLYAVLYEVFKTDGGYECFAGEGRREDVLEKVIIEIN